MHPTRDHERSPRPAGSGSSKPLFDGHPVLTFREDADRRNFIKGAALVGVGATLVTALGGERAAYAAEGPSDMEILKYALTLEELEATFYTKALQGDLLSGRELELVTPIRDHEQQHVKAVKQAIKDAGGQVPDKPQFTFPDGTFTNKSKFLKTASTFEETGVDAYHGQITNIKSPDLLKSAASIAGVESRHAAILADLQGGDPFPAPFEDSKTMDQVLKAVDPYIEGNQS